VYWFSHSTTLLQVPRTSNVLWLEWYQLKAHYEVTSYIITGQSTLWTYKEMVEVTQPLESWVGYVSGMEPQQTSWNTGCGLLLWTWLSGVAYTVSSWNGVCVFVCVCVCVGGCGEETVDAGAWTRPVKVRLVFEMTWHYKLAQHQTELAELWRVALVFCALFPNWLDGQRPIDVFTRHVKATKQARLTAQYNTDGIDGIDPRAALGDKGGVPQPGPDKGRPGGTHQGFECGSLKSSLFGPWNSCEVQANYFKTGT